MRNMESDMNEEQDPIRKWRKILSGRRAKEASELDPTRWRWVLFGETEKGGGWELEPTKGQGGFRRPARSPVLFCLEMRVGGEGRLRNLRLGPRCEKYVDWQCRCHLVAVAGFQIYLLRFSVATDNKNQICLSEKIKSNILPQASLDLGFK